MNSDLYDAYDRLMIAFQDFSNEVKGKDKQLYERWKAGGFIVSDNILSHYPSASEVYEALEGDQIEEENVIQSDILFDEDEIEEETLAIIQDMIEQNDEIADELRKCPPF